MITRLLWKNYRLSSALKYKVKRRFTPAGLLVLAGIFMTGGIGIDTNEAVAYQTFNLLSAVMVISLVWSFARRPSFHAERFLPRVGTAGQPLHYQLRVASLSRHPQQGIAAAEDFGDPRPAFEEFANTPEPGERKRNPFDRFFRFYRWMWLISRNQTAEGREAQLPALRPGQPREIAMEIVPLRRGQMRLKGLNFAVPDPFGLCRSYSKSKAPASVLILPKRYPLPAIDLPGTREYQPGGVELSSTFGESEEFVALREYRRGDPLRHIHWKSVSKTGKLVVKEFENEYFVRHALILDTFLDRPEETAFEEAVSVAASFACTINTQESLLDLLFAGPKAYCLTVGHGVSQLEHMLEILAAVQPCTTGSFKALEALVLQRLDLVSGCVCVFLDWGEPRQELVRRMRMQGVPLLVLVLKEAGTKDPEPGPMRDDRRRFHVLEPGRIEEQLAQL